MHIRAELDVFRVVNAGLRRPSGTDRAHCRHRGWTVALICCSRGVGGLVCCAMQSLSDPKVPHPIRHGWDEVYRASLTASGWKMSQSLNPRPRPRSLVCHSYLATRSQTNPLMEEHLVRRAPAIPTVAVNRKARSQSKRRKVKQRHVECAPKRNLASKLLQLRKFRKRNKSHVRPPSQHPTSALSAIAARSTTTF
nr:hypothetical protein CFP56_07460 [Quercus suber]